MSFLYPAVLFALVVPAALLFAHAAAAGEVRRWQWCVASIAAAFTLLVHRDLIGVTLCDLLSCCQPHTVSALLLLTLVLSTRQPAAGQNRELSGVRTSSMRMTCPSGSVPHSNLVSASRMPRPSA